MIHFDHHAETAARMNIRLNDTLIGAAADLFLGLLQSLLAQVFDGFLHVAIGGFQGLFAVHHARARFLTQFVD